MAHIHIPDQIPARYLPRSSRANMVFGAMFGVGLAAFVVTLFRDSAQAWQAYVVSWLFFTSVAMGAILLAVATTIVRAKWNWSVRRASLSFVAFLPISFLLFLPMLTLGADWFPWVEEMAHDPILQGKAAYLNLPFLYTRSVVGLLVLFSMALFFAFLALRPDAGLTKDDGDQDEGRALWRARLSEGWMGQEAEEVRSFQKMTRMAPVFVMVYAAVMSFIAYDWIMTLAPHWYSTLFGAWFFMSAFWGGIAATAAVATMLKRKGGELGEMIGSRQLHDLGMLAFAFGVFWTYLFWSQYIVIWYGKLPWEQSFVVLRESQPWFWLSVVVVVTCFVLPFAGLLGRAPKMRPLWLRFMAGVILVGLWLERYLLVVPSVRPEGPAMTIWEPLIGLMFLGLFLASVRWFLVTFPVVQIWQPMVEPEFVEAELGSLSGRS